MSEFIDYVFQRSTSLNKIDNSLYSKYNVKNGLRNEDGTGVLVGLTRISDVVGYKKENGKKIDTEGELYYRGVKVSDFIKGHDPKNRLRYRLSFLNPLKETLILWHRRMNGHWRSHRVLAFLWRGSVPLISPRFIGLLSAQSPQLQHLSLRNSQHIYCTPKKCVCQPIG